MRAGAVAITVGTADVGTGNEYPFGTSSGNEYQQVYNSASFPGAMVIDQVSFFLTQFTNPRYDRWATGDYSFYLSTTAVAVNQLSPGDFHANLGPDNALFGTYHLSGSVPHGQINFLGTGFDYDPNEGNLLLTILVANQIAGQDSFVYLDAMIGDAGNLTSRQDNYGYGTSGFGLITSFHGTPAIQSVPDGGSTILLLGFGFLSLAVFAFKRQRK